MDAAFGDAIQTAKNRSAARHELETLINGDKYDDLIKTLTSLGWVHNMGQQKLPWMRQHPDIVLKAYKNKTPSPLNERRIKELLAELKHLPASETTDAIKGLTPQNAVRRLEAVAGNQRIDKAKAEGIVSPDADKAVEVERFHAFGGNDAVKKLMPGAENLPYEERATLLAEQRISELGGSDLIDKIVKLTPRTPVDNALQRAAALQDYKDYLSLGGDKEFLRRGGSFDLELIGGRLRLLREMLSAEEAF